MSEVPPMVYRLLELHVLPTVLHQTEREGKVKYRFCFKRFWDEAKWDFLFGVAIGALITVTIYRIVQ